MLDRKNAGRDHTREDACVDVVSRMYPMPEHWRYEADHDDTDKPFLLCEYAHAMGNGPGGLREYWDLFWSHPRMQGGFVWQWADHGLEQKSADGKVWDAYGGDFGDFPNDGKFTCNGIVFSDRTPSPGLLELKAHQSPVKIDLEDWANGRFAVTNRHDFVDLSDFSLVWSLLCDGVAEAGSTLDCPVLPAGETGTLEIPLLARAVRFHRRGERVVRVGIVTKQETAWAPAGHEVGFFEWQEVEAAAAGLSPLTSARWLTSRTLPQGWEFTFGENQLIFDRQLGRLTSWTLGGVPLLVEGPRLNLFRAFIDNDWQYGLPEGFTKTWQKAGFPELQHRVIGCNLVPHKTQGPEFVVRTRVAAPARTAGFAVEYRYRFLELGGFELLVDVDPQGDWPHLPRIGLDLKVPGEFQTARWYGLGPGESYSDSWAGVKTGVWAADLEDLHTPYAVPQENGNRDQTRWMGLYDERGTGLWVTGGERFGFGAHPYSIADLDAAKHRHELLRRDEVTVTLDHRQCGVGSGACGPLTFETDRVPAQRSTFRFVFCAHSRQERSSEQLYQRVHDRRRQERSC